MYGPEHDRMRTEDAWTHILLDFLGQYIGIGMHHARSCLPILQVLVEGWANRHAPNTKLNEVSTLLVQTRQHEMGNRFWSLAENLVAFQRRYLRDRPGDMLKQEQPTLADLEEWYQAQRAWLNEARGKVWMLL